MCLWLQVKDVRRSLRHSGAHRAEWKARRPEGDRGEGQTVLEAGGGLCSLRVSEVTRPESTMGSIMFCPLNKYLERLVFCVRECPDKPFDDEM